MKEFKVGDKVKIVYNSSSHGFNLGDIVTITEVNDTDYKAEYDNKRWYLNEKDIKGLKDNSQGFKECFDCSQKIGSPTLCAQCLWVRENYKPEIKPKFEVGDKAIKSKGYKFDSEIVSVFRTTAGEIRIVAENGDGLLHIFNESNLEHEF